MNMRELHEREQEQSKVARMLILQACQTGFNLPDHAGGDMMQPSRLFNNRPLWYDYMVREVREWMEANYKPFMTGIPRLIHVPRFTIEYEPTPPKPAPTPRNTLTKHEPVTLEDGRPGARIDMTEVLTEDEQMAEDAMYADPFEDYYDYD